MTLICQFEVFEVGHLKRELYVLLRQNLCTLSTEVIEAEVCGGIHTAPLAIVGAGQLEAELAHLAQAREIHITPVIDDVRIAGITQVGQIVFLSSSCIIVGIIANDGQLEPVALAKLLGITVAINH